MFGLVNRTRFERVSNDSGVSSRKTPSPPPEEEEMDDETYERRARLCHGKLVVPCISCKLYVTCYGLFIYMPLWYAA